MVNVYLLPYILLAWVSPDNPTTNVLEKYKKIIKKVFSLFSATFKLKKYIAWGNETIFTYCTQVFHHFSKKFIFFPFLNTMGDKTAIMVMFQLSLLSEYILRTFNNLYVIYFIPVTTDAAATAPIYANH